jgi:MYXO-CTERM domain-containing protein
MNGMRLQVLGLSGLALVLSCAPEPPPRGAAGPAVAASRPPRVAPSAPVRVFPGLLASAIDEARSVPRFVRATTRQPAPAGASAATAARAHLERHAAAWRVTPAHLAAAEVQAVHDTGRGGIIVALQQRAHGVEVYRGAVKVLMRRDLELVAIAGSPAPLPDTLPAFARPTHQALADALGAHYAAAVPGAVDLGPEEGGYRLVDLTAPLAVPAGTLRLGEPARVKPVLVPQGERLRPAYFVEFFAGTGARTHADAFRYVIAADDGRVLERRNLTMHWNYRVWADADGRPLDGPLADFTPHPTGTPDGSQPDFVAPSLITMDGFNHNPDGLADPWLPESATESRGNNVDAYVDHSAPDGFSGSDFRATPTSVGTFDRVYDVGVDPSSSDNQAQASLINAFYAINWLHDWYYDSGFDEAAGNAQADNYGRGGLGNDRLLFEGQDYYGTDNSDMSTPADGRSPRMQAYVWTGTSTATLTATPGGTLQTGSASFGATTFDVTGEVVLGVDGTAPVNDGCEAITNDVSGKIALLDRGLCTFKQKAVLAQGAGAIAVILANNQGGAPPDMPPSDYPGTVTIPMVSITQAAGAAMKTALGSGTVTAHLTGVGSVDRDGALDTTVVAHEWGHYMHLRLADCAQYQCFALSEGWADFTALLMMLRPGDDLDGTYAKATYAARSMGDSGYFGIRRAPYSTDMTKNPFTFRHIMDSADLPTTAPLQQNGASNSEVHAAGEIWAVMLFEAYVALLKTTQAAGAVRTFADVQRDMTDYVVAALKLTPADATYTEQRDALLAAATAANPDDVGVLAAAFAKRGAGSCAAAPPRESYDFEGVVESFEVGPSIVLGAPTLDDSAASCDSDGVLDAGEGGFLSLPVVNASPMPTAAVTVTASSSHPDVSFPEGATVTLGALAPFASATAKIRVDLARSMTALRLVDFGLAVDAPDACEPHLQRPSAFRVNYAVVAAASATDDVESPESTWTPDGTDVGSAWSRVESGPGNHVWRGLDLSWVADNWLVSPPLDVSATEKLVLGFTHKYDFEASEYQGEFLYWDGAVVEITKDAGSTWEDVSTWADPGYAGALTDIADNPLSNREAYSGQNPSYPDRDQVTLDLGTAFAGETVQVRFRIGTDQAAANYAWEIDDITFTGVTNTPFATLVESPSACPSGAQDDGGATAGDGGGDDGGDGGDGDGRGCGCRASGDLPPTALLLLAVALLLARRRR